MRPARVMWVGLCTVLPLRARPRTSYWLSTPTDDMRKHVPPAAHSLLERDVRARAVTERIRAEHEVDSLRGIDEIERRGFAQAAGPHGAVVSLQIAAARHVEFVDDDAFVDIGDANMHGQPGGADSERAEKEATGRTAAID